MKHKRTALFIHAIKGRETVSSSFVGAFAYGGAFIRSRLRNGFTPPLLKALTFIKAFYVYIYHT